jgi:hypothetical protein
MPKTQTDQPASEDFSNMVNLLAVYSEASNRLDELQALANGSLLELIDAHKTEYADLQHTLTESETALEVIALRHPEWFAKDKRSIKTPYGTVKFHASSKLEIKNEEVTLLLLDKLAAENKQFKRADYVREKEELNLEALEKLDEATLKKLRIERVPNDNFSVVAAKVNMGKAVKEAVEREAAA